MRTRNRILLTSLDIDLIWRPTVPSSTRMTTRYVPSRYKITKPTLVLPQLQHWLPRETTCWLQEYGVILIHWGWFGNTKSLYFNYCFWVDYQSSKFLYSCFAGDCSSEGGFEVCMHIFLRCIRFLVSQLDGTYGRDFEHLCALNFFWLLLLLLLLPLRLWCYHGVR